VEHGQTGERVLSFPKTGSFQMAYQIPGHHEAGMQGSVTVVPASGISVASPVV
jgi:uncharacterized cupredoxin-like copper-binding protein